MDRGGASPGRGARLDYSAPLARIQALVEDEALQLSLFDEQDLFEFTSDDNPDERLVACRNPLLARKRALQREDLLLGTKRELEINDDGFTYARNQDEFPEKGERGPSVVAPDALRSEHIRTGHRPNSASAPGIRAAPGLKAHMTVPSNA